MKVSETRLVLAYLLAPLATVPTLAAIVALIASGDSSLAALVGGAVHISFFLALFGLPVAYAAELVLVQLCRVRNIDPEQVSWRRVLSWTTICGAAVFPAIWRVMFGGTVLTALSLVPVGALMGVASGTTFMIVRGRSSAVPGAI